MTDYASAPTELLSRLPPHSIPAEQAVIGAILRDPKSAFDAPSLLRAEDFYQYAHRLIFRECQGETAAGRTPELVAVWERLRAAKAVEDCGGVEYLTKLYDEVPTGANMEYYAAIVRDYSLRRQLIHVTTVAIRDAYGKSGSTDELIATLEGNLFGLTKSGPSDVITHIRTPAGAEYERLKDTIGKPRQAPGIPTGFLDLDSLTGGWREGLYVVAARPSVGKTSWLLTSALRAVAAGVPAIVFSLEMSADQLAQRILAMESGVNLGRIRTGRELTNDEVERLGGTAGSLKTTSLFVCDQSLIRVDDVAALVRRAVRQYGVGIVYLDYLQLLKPENPRMGRAEQLEVISRGMKMISRQTKLPVVCMAQLNRAAEDRDQPKMSDLRGSGAIEQDADDVYLLWRKQSDAEAPVWSIGLDVAKQRNGPVGEIDLCFRRAVARFENYCPDVPD